MLYGTFSIEDAKSVGKKFEAVCKANWDYEEQLTEGKTYTITIEERIMPTSPLCSFTSDKGKFCHAHLTRFEKVKEL